MPAAEMPMPCWPARLLAAGGTSSRRAACRRSAGSAPGRCPARCPATATRKRSSASSLDLDLDVGQDAGLLAGVERVVDGLLDRGQQRLRRVVEAEQVAVLGEELGDRDLALALPIDSAVSRRPAAAGRAGLRATVAASMPGAAGDAGGSVAGAAAVTGAAAFFAGAVAARGRRAPLRRAGPAVVSRAGLPSPVAVRLKRSICTTLPRAFAAGLDGRAGACCAFRFRTAAIRAFLSTRGF